MAKRPRGDHPEETQDQGTAPEAKELFRVATTVPRTIINGHVLTVGTVVELTQDEIDANRAGGVALEDVHPEDKRDVYSVREPYVAKDENE